MALMPTASFRVRSATSRNSKGAAMAEYTDTLKIGSSFPLFFSPQYCNSTDCGVEYSRRSMVLQSDGKFTGGSHTQ